MPKLNIAIFAYVNETTGNIEIMFNNTYKITYIDFVYCKWRNGNDDYTIKSTNIGGSVFSNKYDLRILEIASYTSINGEIKDLKNLKKLYIVSLSSSACTGSKTDLYNNGANITGFYI